MIDDLLQIHDVVAVTIPGENREWGHNPCPDGTYAVVLGFSEIAFGRIGNYGVTPGIYTNRAWVRIYLETSGRDYYEYAGHLELVDKEEYKKREKAWRASLKPGEFSAKEFLRDLPETPFWEDDKVRVLTPACKPYESLKVIDIDYSALVRESGDNQPPSPYRVSSEIGAGWHTYNRESELELIERGRVWKYYHDEPIEFADIQEEAKFFSLLGHTEEVRNPETGFYRWTEEEVLEAIRIGIVDGFMMSSGFFGGESNINAIKYRDEDLGRRVAAETLKGFSASR